MTLSIEGGARSFSGDKSPLPWGANRDVIRTFARVSHGVGAPAIGPVEAEAPATDYISVGTIAEPPAINPKPAEVPNGADQIGSEYYAP